jgi:hypothetical protein
MEVSGHLHIPAAYPWGQSLQYPLDRRLDGPQSWSGYYAVEKSLLPLPGFEPQPSSPQPTAIMTQPFQLLLQEYVKREKLTVKNIMRHLIPGTNKISDIRTSEWSSLHSYLCWQWDWKNLPLFMLILFLDLCTIWMWAVQPMFWRYMLPPSSRLK